MSENHHYIPQFILRGFKSKNISDSSSNEPKMRKGDCLFVFNKDNLMDFQKQKNGTIECMAIKKTAQEPNFYQHLEHDFFKRIDDLGSKVIRSCNSDISRFIAAQILRVPFVHENAKRAKISLQKCGLDEQSNIDDSKRSFLEAIQSLIQYYTQHLSEKKYCLVKISQNEEMIISDNPVRKLEGSGYNFSSSSPGYSPLIGETIFFPITKNLLLIGSSNHSLPGSPNGFLSFDDIKNFLGTIAFPSNNNEAEFISQLNHDQYVFAEKYIFGSTQNIISKTILESSQYDANIPGLNDQRRQDILNGAYLIDHRPVPIGITPECVSRLLISRLGNNYIRPVFLDYNINSDEQLLNVIGNCILLNHGSSLYAITPYKSFFSNLSNNLAYKVLLNYYYDNETETETVQWLTLNTSPKNHILSENNVDNSADNKIVIFQIESSLDESIKETHFYPIIIPEENIAPSNSRNDMYVYIATNQFKGCYFFKESISLIRPYFFIINKIEQSPQNGFDFSLSLEIPPNTLLSDSTIEGGAILYTDKHNNLIIKGVVIEYDESQKNYRCLSLDTIRKCIDKNK